MGKKLEKLTEKSLSNSCKLLMSTPTGTFAHNILTERIPPSTSSVRKGGISFYWQNSASMSDMLGRFKVSLITENHRGKKKKVIQLKYSEFSPDFHIDCEWLNKVARNSFTATAPFNLTSRAKAPRHWRKWKTKGSEQLGVNRAIRRPLPTISTMAMQVWDLLTRLQLHGKGLQRLKAP